MLICIVMGSNLGGIFILYTRQEIYHVLLCSSTALRPNSILQSGNARTINTINDFWSVFLLFHHGNFDLILHLIYKSHEDNAVKHWYASHWFLILATDILRWSIITCSVWYSTIIDPNLYLRTGRTFHGAQRRKMASYYTVFWNIYKFFCLQRGMQWWLGRSTMNC
jgi:hypothetical protein